jgi:hypothetical protein
MKIGGAVPNIGKAPRVALAKKLRFGGALEIGFVMAPENGVENGVLTVLFYQLAMRSGYEFDLYSSLSRTAYKSDDIWIAWKEINPQFRRRNSDQTALNIGAALQQPKREPKKSPRLHPDGEHQALVKGIGRGKRTVEINA